VFTQRKYAVIDTLSLVLKIFLELSRGGDHDLGTGCTRSRTNSFNLLDDIQTLGDLSEDNVLSIEPRGLSGTEDSSEYSNTREVKLTLGSVGVGSSVGHGQDSRSSVLEHEVLISELSTVDGLSTGTYTFGWERATRSVHQVRSNVSQKEIQHSQSGFYVPLWLVKSPPWHMNPGMTRWKLQTVKQKKD
jgi:hypothetical protein